MLFKGIIGKNMMIEQGYVPSTCTLPVELAGPLIWSEISAGRDPCAGCRHDRSVCGGRPNTESAGVPCAGYENPRVQNARIDEIVSSMTRSDKERRARQYDFLYQRQQDINLNYPLPASADVDGELDYDLGNDDGARRDPHGDKSR